MLLLHMVNTLFTADDIDESIKRISNNIMNEYSPEEEIVIVCLLKGGLVFTSDLIRKIDRTIHVDFILASSYGNNFESSGNINIKLDISMDIHNKNVIVIDDIIDTGNTLFEIKKHLQKKNPKSIELCCLLDKSERRVKDINIDYVGLPCPNKFVVGYGMDAYGIYRNLPYIGYLN